MTTATARRKLLIDADSGIDDAMALVLALDAHRRGEADVLGVTCVNGNTSVEHSRVNVLRVLDVMGCPEARTNTNRKRRWADRPGCPNGFNSFNFLTREGDLGQTL